MPWGRDTSPMGLSLAFKREIDLDIGISPRSLFWERIPKNRQGRVKRTKWRIRAAMLQYILGSVLLDTHRSCAESAPDV